jgi:nicotinate-nucleotide pyrophosphorylase (carboxylating)
MKNFTSHLIKLALAEDECRKDRTTRLLVPCQLSGKAQITTRERSVAAGLEIGRRIFKKLDPKIQYRTLVKEGKLCKSGTPLAEIRGPLNSILRGERTVLNFLQRLCGIATRTQKYVEAVKPHHVTIWDTRKTIPGWRELDKYAVKIGGGHNHRSSLKTGIMIKDNHLLTCGGISVAAKKLRQASIPFSRVVLEVDTLSQLKEALQLGFKHILLDNFTPRELRKAVQLNQDRAILEASGGITLQNIKSIAATGVDRISIGALTHSVKTTDLSLEIIVPK